MTVNLEHAYVGKKVLFMDGSIRTIRRIGISLIGTPEKYFIYFDNDVSRCMSAPLYTSQSPTFKKNGQIISFHTHMGRNGETVCQDNNDIISLLNEKLQE